MVYRGERGGRRAALGSESVTDCYPLPLVHGSTVGELTHDNVTIIVSRATEKNGASVVKVRSIL
jgi:hypothetical protein